MRLREPYRPRPVVPLGVEAYDGWHIKVYGIAYERAEPRRELVEVAKLAAAERLPQPAETETRYGVGFLGIRMADYRPFPKGNRRPVRPPAALAP